MGRADFKGVVDGLLRQHRRAAGRDAAPRLRQQHRRRNLALLDAALTAATLLAWLTLLALDGTLARAEPKTLRYRILHAAVRLTRSGRRRRLKIQASWPWATDIVTAWDRISALPRAP